LLANTAKETEEPYVWLEECPAKILLDKKRHSLKSCNVGIVIKKDFHSYEKHASIYAKPPRSNVMAVFLRSLLLVFIFSTMTI